MIVATILTASMCLQENEPRESVLAELRVHLSALHPIQANAEYSGWLSDEASKLYDSSEFTKRDKWLKEKYSTSVLEWKRSADFRMWKIQDGNGNSQVLSDGRRTTSFSPDKEQASIRSGILHPLDILPDIYFLEYEGVPLGGMLDDAELKQSTSEPVVQIELSSESYPYIVRLQFRTQPRRIESIQFWRSNDSSEEVCPIEFTFSDFLKVGDGEEFPSKIEAAFYRFSGITRVKCEEKEVRLSGISNVPIEQVWEIDLPDGTRMADFTESAISPRVYYIGKAPEAVFLDALKDLRTWSSSRPDVTIFGEIPGEFVPNTNIRVEFKSDIDSRPELCGPYSLLMILYLAGWQESVGVLLGGWPHDLSNGTTIEVLAEVASEYQLTPRPVKVSKQDLLAAERPAILQVKVQAHHEAESHFIAAIGKVGDKLIVVDPPHRARVVSDEWLQHHWVGNALLLGDESKSNHPMMAMVAGSALVAVSLVAYSATRVIRKRASLK